ncbi:MAG: carboxyltransferase domain-containing protein [Leptolyngbya sp. SIO4C1]|nr:carboxyltransferase domain-containing protein [Leptolyngbya sp. SIO4C1]
MLVELGDRADLATNFKAIALAKSLMQTAPLTLAGIGAITDAVPSFTTVLVRYNPSLLTYQGVVQLCDCLFQQLRHQADIELASRLIEVPVVYNDRWCRACFEHYCKTVKPIEDNVALVSRLNGLDSVDALIERHTQSEWWVGAVGFVAGLPTLMPLDPQACLYAPKYDPPRTWTPKGTVGVGGGFTTLYPIEIPDGYQMIGRTPLPIFDPAQTLPAFQESPLLFRVGDRVKFRATCEAEFELIEHELEQGRFNFAVSLPQPYSLSAALPAALPVQPISA